MGELRKFKDDYKKVGQTVCDKFLESFKNPGSLKIPGPPDTYLYSKEGVGIKVHRLILAQTRFMRRILSLMSCNCRCSTSNDTVDHILLPDVTLRQLKVAVKFFYTGIIKCFAYEYSDVMKVLCNVFGVPPNIAISMESNSSMPDSVVCYFCNEEEIRVQDYFDHLWAHVTDELEEIKVDLTSGSVNKVECIICKYVISQPVTSSKDQTSFQFVEEHYLHHRSDFKEYIKKEHGFVATDSEEPQVAPQPADLSTSKTQDQDSLRLLADEPTAGTSFQAQDDQPGRVPKLVIKLNKVNKSKREKIISSTSTDSVTDDESSSEEISLQKSPTNSSTKKITFHRQKFVESSSSSSSEETNEERLPSNSAKILEKQKRVVGRRRVIIDSSDEEPSSLTTEVGEKLPTECSKRKQNVVKSSKVSATNAEDKKQPKIVKTFSQSDVTGVINEPKTCGMLTAAQPESSTQRANPVLIGNSSQFQILPLPKTKKEPELMVCIFCNNCISRPGMVKHSVNHHPLIFEGIALNRNLNDVFPCPRCNLTFKTVQLVKNHLVSKHSLFQDYLNRKDQSIEDLYLPSAGDIYNADILDKAQEIIEPDTSAQHQEDPEHETSSLGQRVGASLQNSTNSSTAALATKKSN